ncbi:DUF1761 domain-containing protein [Paraferrimonas sedimenticola]|uniref:DUF1761 domain-containing protein n=1 Tax=Paraferrimonas sedimenticola TaxID=375674 RepID=A0AA37RVA9_9GAMM|nr:DUF1761 domain-containing protein [Paraferrimonas sedimenticola]GLP95881.1 hypothetical protein GCM10007895_11870 [Paraferrimonas sedimenticola]
MHQLAQLDWLAIIVAAVAAFMVGGVWFGPLFGKAWMAEHGFKEEDFVGQDTKGIMLKSFLLHIVVVFGLAMLLVGQTSWMVGLHSGLFTAFFLVAASTGINFIYEGKSLKLWGIYAGHQVLMYGVAGVVLVLMS